MDRIQEEEKVTCRSCGWSGLSTELEELEDCTMGEWSHWEVCPKCHSDDGLEY